LTSLIEIGRPSDFALLRRAYVGNLLSIDGIKCSNFSHRSTWLELLGPINGSWDLERPFKVWKDNNGKYHTEGVSTCGLVAEGIWRRMKVDLDALYKPYLFGSAITRAVTFAKNQNAWFTPASGKRPEPGDYVVIGNGLKTHALTCEQWEGNNLMSIDGGQVDDKNLQAIASRSRLWHQNHNPMLEDREVQGWVDITCLPYRGSTCQVPAGFVTVNGVTTDKYVYTGGYFVNSNNNSWEEWQNGRKIYVFAESNRDDNWITLYDASRNIFVSLPINGGKSYYAWGGSKEWVPLYDVTWRN